MNTSESSKTAARFSILVILACGLAGCRATVPSAFGAREFSWGQEDPGRPSVLGVDKALVQFGVWGDGAAVAIWSDGKGGSFGGGGMGGAPLEPGETKRGVRYEGRIASQEGRVVQVRCYTPDGKTGTVEIGGGTYDLSRGGLFLVALGAAEPKVKQLDLARLDLKPSGLRMLNEITRESLEELAKTDPEIRAFFAEAAKSD